MRNVPLHVTVLVPVVFAYVVRSYIFRQSLLAVVLPACISVLNCSQFTVHVCWWWSGVCANRDLYG